MAIEKCGNIAIALFLNPKPSFIPKLAAAFNSPLFFNFF
jgi:hypothetical protein